MKNIFFITGLCLAVYVNNANAQIVGGESGDQGLSAAYLVLTQYNSVPVRESAYLDVEGDRFLINDWVNGVVIFKENKKFSATLKYDIYNHTLLFKDKDGEALELKNPITGFTLTNTHTDFTNVSPLIFVNGLPAIGMLTEDSWYQLIGGGKVKLLKYYKKTIDEQHQYITATTTHKFMPFQYYYVFKNNQMTDFTPNKKSIQKLFEDHAAQLDAWLKTNNINYKSDADLQKLFTWYNSLN